MMHYHLTLNWSHLVPASARNSCKGRLTSFRYDDDDDVDDDDDDFTLLYSTFVVLVEVPEILPVVVLDDGNNAAGVVRSDIELVAEVGVVMRRLLLMLLMLFLTRRVVERRVSEHERHLKRWAERSNRVDGVRSLRREERKHSPWHHVAYYNNQLWQEAQLAQRLRASAVITPLKVIQGHWFWY